MYGLHAPVLPGTNAGKLSHPLAAGIRWMYIVPPWHTNSNKLQPDDTGLSYTHATTLYTTSRLGVTPWGFHCAQMIGTEIVPLYRVRRNLKDSDAPFTTIAFVTIEGATNVSRDAVNKGDIGTTNGTWSLGLGSVAKRFRASIRLSGTLYSAQMSYDAEVGRWYCIAMTYDNDTLSLYVDGREEASSAIGISYTDSDAYYNVGIRSTFSSSTNWNGWIGSVLHYKRALSPYEISSIASDPRFTWWFGETINYRCLEQIPTGILLTGEASLSAVSDFNADLRKLLSGQLTMQAVSELSAGARKTLFGQLTSQGVALLTADGVLITPDPSARLQSVAVLSVDARLNRTGVAYLESASVLSVDPRRGVSSAMSLICVAKVFANGTVYGSVPVVVLPARVLLSDRGAVSAFVEHTGKTSIKLED